MVKLAILRLYGDLDRQGFEVVLELGCETQRPDLELRGTLPANPALLQHLKTHWEGNYRAVGSPSSHRAFRLKPKQIAYEDSLPLMRECRQSSEVLERQFQDWLRSPSFRELDVRLREELNRDDEVRVLVRSDRSDVLKLPWHLWDFVRRYPKAEVSFGFQSAVKATPTAIRRPRRNVRVLAVLGHDDGIDIERDRDFLNRLPNTDVTFLVQPRRQDIGDRLWEQPWDAIFFAGHSESDGDTGKIYINHDESLSLDDLWYGLRQAIDRGLKLAIFNSCDGLGLVRGLDDCQIPIAIVMRELVPDKVAHEFLKYFLQGFCNGKAFHMAVRDARERLKGLEDRYPCASWLPVILQHPAEIPPSWPSWTRDAPPAPVPRRLAALGKAVLAIALAVTAVVVGLRWGGVLQASELSAYDRLMRSRPLETPDDRLLLVGIDEGDIDRYGYPIPDDVLAEAIARLDGDRPIAIGLNLYRDRDEPPGSDRLAQQFRTNRRLVSTCNFTLGAPNDWVAPPTASPLTQQGYDNVPIDSWGYSVTVRRYFLSRDDTASIYDTPCQTPVSLGWQMAARYFQAHDLPVTTTGEDSPQGMRLHVNGRVIPRLVQHSAGYHRLEARGKSEFYQLPLLYRHTRKPQEVVPTVSLRDVLAGRVEGDRVRDRLVSLGMTAESVDNWSVTPYGWMRGSVLQAHLTSQLVAAAGGERPLVWWLPAWADSLWIGLWTLLGAAIVARWRKEAPKLAIALIGASGLLYAICRLAFWQALWLPWIPALLGLLLASTAAAIALPGLQRWFEPGDAVTRER